MTLPTPKPMGKVVALEPPEQDPLTHRAQGRGPASPRLRAKQPLPHLRDSIRLY